MTSLIAGIDGCRHGWVAAIAPADQWTEVQVRVFPRFSDIVEFGSFVHIAIDMPIGLPEKAGPGGRGPERAIRPLLGARRSSVFSVPARCAVYTEKYADACTVALMHSDPPRKISRQAHAIFYKIRELDGLLRDNAELRDIVHEVHPELAFWRLNGEKPLQFGKKVRGRPATNGLDERRKLLLSAGLPNAIVSSKAPRGAGVDDMLDALAGLFVAKRLVEGTAEPFPKSPIRDNHGLLMAIWA
jgi:predicted RNase H-like nuclease